MGLEQCKCDSLTFSFNGWGLHSSEDMLLQLQGRSESPVSNASASKMVQVQQVTRQRFVVDPTMLFGSFAGSNRKSSKTLTVVSPSSGF